jgi:hypothetical protein
MRTKVKYVIFDDDEDKKILEEINRVIGIKGIDEFISEYPALYEFMICLKRAKNEKI